MTFPGWELVTRIFESAIDQPQSGQNDFVRRQCKGDLELEAEVLRLLAADQQAGSFLESPALITVSAESLLHSQMPLLATGSVVSDRFEILRFIGQGGMGQVYEALDLELKERVALKAIRAEIAADPRMLSRFRREVQLTRRITHPNVCRTFDIERHSSSADDGTRADLTFLTMELLEGETLADLLRREGRLTTAGALPLVLQMIEALSAAHSVGIIHRDFKPSNVLLVPSDTSASGSLRVVVTDFGLARALVPDGRNVADHAATSLTGNQGLMGTLVYMAPEQFERGEATVASDIYSLGLVIYEMVTGVRPFADPIPFAEAAKRLKQPAPSAKILVTNVNPAWEAAIGKCLEREAENRFQTARDVAEDITRKNAPTSRSASQRRSLKRAKTAVSPAPKRGRVWRMWAAGVAVFTIAVALISVELRLYQLRRDAKLAGGATVLLTEIRNSTGDQRFDGTTELIRHQLSQSPYFNLMDAGRIREVLTQMTKPPDARLDPPIAREVALRSGAPRIIFGAVSRVGDSYVLDLDIQQPDNNPRRPRAQWENHWTWNMSSASSDKEIPNAFLTAVRDGGDWIRSQVGEMANDIAIMDRPPEDVTTDNWAALSEFAQAEKFDETGRTENSIMALQNAVAADPHFALAYTRLADELVSLGRYDEGYRAYRIALDQQGERQLTRKERDRLVGIFALDTGNFAVAEKTFADYAVYFKNDYLGFFYRAYPLMMLGRVEEAIASLKKASELNPSGVSPAAHIARYELILGNFQESAKWIQRLRDARHADEADRIEGQSEFLQGRYPEAESLFLKLSQSSNPLTSSYGYSRLTRLYAELGDYEKAMDASKKGIEGDVAAGNTARRADKTLDRAYINGKRGQYALCLQDTGEALNLDRSLQRSLTSATLLGQAAADAPRGMKAQFVSELRAIEEHLPAADFKPVSDIVRDHLGGEILLAEGDWKDALKQFEAANILEAPYEDKEYLARALLVKAQHTPNQAETAALRNEALKDYSVLALKPGLVWQWAENYFPGYAADSAMAYAKLAKQNGAAPVPNKRP